MNKYYKITREDWDKTLLKLTQQYNIYVPVMYGNNQDYELLESDLVNQIVYNQPKPATPLKTFFHPIKENVVNLHEHEKKRVIIGVPACDLEALDIQDEMYLNRDFEDPAYKKHRDSTILIGTDCHSSQEHCHCTTYNVKPYPEKNQDITLTFTQGLIYLYTNSEKGEEFLNQAERFISYNEPTENEIQNILDKRTEIEQELDQKNKEIPDYKTTGELIQQSGTDIWEKVFGNVCFLWGMCHDMSYMHVFSVTGKTRV